MPDYSYQDSLAGEEGGFGDPQGLPPSEWEDPGTFSDSDSAWEERERAWARLPKSRPQPKVETIHSADLERTICVHELAFGIAVASGSDPAADEVPKAITQFAYSVFGWIDLMPPCEHKEPR